jgi:hypothetical protein
LWNLADPTKSEETLPSDKIENEIKFGKGHKSWVMVLLLLVKLPTWKHDLRINLGEAWFQTFWIGSAQMSLRSWNWSCKLNLPRRNHIRPTALYIIIPSDLSRWHQSITYWSLKQDFRRSRFNNVNRIRIAHQGSGWNLNHNSM